MKMDRNSVKNIGLDRLGTATRKNCQKVCSTFYNSFDIFLLVLQEHFVLSKVQEEEKSSKIARKSSATFGSLRKSSETFGK